MGRVGGASLHAQTAICNGERKTQNSRRRKANLIAFEKIYAYSGVTMKGNATVIWTLRIVRLFLKAEKKWTASIIIPADEKLNPAYLLMLLMPFGSSSALLTMDW